MIKCAMIKNSNKAKSAYIETLDIPNFYMEDFSVLGITVGNFPAARKLLQNNGYIVESRGPGLDIVLRNFNELRSVTDLLDKNGFSPNYEDIADVFYQA